MRPHSTRLPSCEHCGDTFTPKDPRPRRPHRFCSRECYFAFYRARRLRVCEQCGGTFEGLPKNTAHKLRFCSSRCYGIWQRGRPGPPNATYSPVTRFGKRFQENRLIALDRDGHRCRVCSGTNLLRAHHFIPYSRRDPETHHPDNLITLCNACHVRTHAAMRGEAVTGPYLTVGPRRKES